MPYPVHDTCFGSDMAMDYGTSEGARKRGHGYHDWQHVRESMTLKPKPHSSPESGMKAFHVHVGDDPNPIGEIHEHSHTPSKNIYGNVGIKGKTQKKWTGTHSESKASVGHGQAKEHTLEKMAQKHFSHLGGAATRE